MNIGKTQDNPAPVHSAKHSDRLRERHRTESSYVVAQPRDGIAAISEDFQQSEDVGSFPRYGFMLSTTPDGSTTPNSSGEESMVNHGEDAPACRPSDQLEHTPDLAMANLSRLSLARERSIQSPRDANTAGSQHGSSNNAPKRAASSAGCPPRQKKATLAEPNQRTSPSAKRMCARSDKFTKQSVPRRDPRHPSLFDGSHVGQVQASPTNQRQPYARDSGYETQPSRSSTLQPDKKFQGCPQPPEILSTLSEEPSLDMRSPMPAVDTFVPTMIKQPKSSPISTDQLAAEVRGIYSGLIMVESKCINIDAAQAKDPMCKLGSEQYQALIALHRTLLYEHHDFLMATQHPSATDALRGLAEKYSMPARMWRHGIHAFLEVLRHRRPESQDYMLAFIYLAYQMMCLLYETVQRFENTWIECLGDLARYRMAIEDEAEARFIWGGVASRWYHIASDKQPATGRLYHHLGILERPSLRKFFLYAKSLTCVVPFPNARDSLTTLCLSIMQDFEKGGASSAEASTVIVYAMAHSDSSNLKMSEVASRALSQLSKQSTSKNRDIGVELVVSSVAVLLEQGSPNNFIWQHFARAINDDIQEQRPSANTPGPPMIKHPDTGDGLFDLDPTKPSLLVTDFCYSVFNILIRARSEPQFLRNALGAAHVILVWLHSLVFLQTRMDNGLDTCGSLLSNSFSWGGLSGFLNLVAQTEAIDSSMIDFARRGEFLSSKSLEGIEPLSEDYSIHGLIWSQFHYPTDWFPKEKLDDGRTIDEAAIHKARCRRVLWLGLYLAFRVDQLNFDTDSKFFSSPLQTCLIQHAQDEAKSTTEEQEPKTAAVDTATPRTSMTLSAHSDSDGFTSVRPRKKDSRSQTQVGTKPTKRRPEHADVKILDEESLQFGRLP